MTLLTSEELARSVHITDRVNLVDGSADVFDLDAATIVSAECP